MSDYKNLEDSEEFRDSLNLINTCSQVLVDALHVTGLEPKEALCLISAHCLAAIMIMHEDIADQKKFSAKSIKIARELANEVKEIQEREGL